MTVVQLLYSLPPGFWYLAGCLTPFGVCTILGFLILRLEADYSQPTEPGSQE